MCGVAEICIGKLQVLLNHVLLHVRFEFFTMVKFKVKILWVVMYDVVIRYQQFRGPCCLHLQVS